MPGYRLPGVLCALTNALPMDSGTLARVATPSPSPAGAANKHSLSDYDLELIRSTAGKKIDGTPKPLPELQYLRGIHAQRKADGVREFGPQSWAALFEQATVDQITELIELAQSPEGVANDELRKVIEEAKKPGSAVTDEQMSQAVAVVLGHERQRQLLGGGEGDSSEAMALVNEAMGVHAARKNTALKQLLGRARLPGSPVSDEQITKAVQDVLGSERQLQLLGAGEGESEAMGLVVEALGVAVDRKQTALKNLIEKAKAPGSAVTDEQLRKAVADVLGAERQCQLLGASESGPGGSSMALVVAAAKVSLDRKSAALAKLYDAGAPEAQISQARADYESAKAQYRQLGGTVPEARVTTGPMEVKPQAPRN